MNTPDYAFKHGAVGILDVLGFKGIWKNNPLNVLASLITIKKKVLEFCSTRINANDFSAGFLSQEQKNMVASSLKFSFSLFSDTAMVCTYCSEEIISIIPDQETRELVTGFLLLELCSEVVELIYKFGLFSDPILINRGAISVGQVAVWKDVVIGPAVDEAASLMDIADGGIVIFSENCRKYEAYRHDFQDASVRAHEVQGLRDAAPELIKNSMVIRDYPVPLKIGKELSMNVLKIHAIQEEALPGVLEKLNNKMTSNDPSILLKKRNTLSYLNFCWGIAID